MAAGLEHSRWDDGNTDDVKTKFSGEERDFDTSGVDVDHITMELHRSDTWTPDEDYGGHELVCTPTSAAHTVTWTDKGSGEFYMTLQKVNGSTVSYWGHVSCDWLKISY